MPRYRVIDPEQNVIDEKEFADDTKAYDWFKTVEVPDDSLGYDAAQDRVDVAPMALDVELGNMYTKEIEGFGNAILNDTVPPVSGDDALQVQKVVILKQIGV